MFTSLKISKSGDHYILKNSANKDEVKLKWVSYIEKGVKRNKLSDTEIGIISITSSDYSF